MNQSRESRAELLANLHLIKLFVYYTLRYERAIQRSGALSKLEAACIETSFAEMRAEGYADDGLFPTMGEFFLPLTISERELRSPRRTVSSEAREARIQPLTERVDRLERLLAETTMHRSDVAEQVTKMNQRIEQEHAAYMNERSQVDTAITSRQRATALQEIDRRWQIKRQELEQQLLTLKRALDRWVSCTDDYEKQIDTHNTTISNIRTELLQPVRPVDKGLVKPARGFIMYGPPGTHCFPHAHFSR